MATNTNPIFPIAPVSVGTAFVNADGTTAKTIYTPTLANGARVDCIMATNSDTVARTLVLFLKRGGVMFCLGAAVIPIGAGWSGAVQPVNLFEAIGAASGGPSPFLTDPAGNKYLVLDATSTLFAEMLTTVTSGGAVVATVVFGGEY